MRRPRTIYFNDARHYYLFVFEPPITMDDAHRPVDECAGTGVDTFVYGVARDDGLFYPSKVGRRFTGTDSGAPTGVPLAAYWRLWHNMQSLIDRGLDPLTVLIDRAHEKKMEFFASLRLGAHGGMDPSDGVRNGGPGFAHASLRNHQFEVLRELAHDYPTDGIELDFAAPPAGSAPLLRDEDVAAHTDTITQWVRDVAQMVRAGDTPGQVGARVYPIETMNRDAGYDVRAWLAEGLMDHVIPMVYGCNIVDSTMPIDWLVTAAHEADTSVYPMIQPDHHAWGDRPREPGRYATPAMMRAASANYWDKGADGLATWFLRWPLQDDERSILRALGDPDQVRQSTKHYVVGRRTEISEMAGYEAVLPLEIAADDVGSRHRVPFVIADDPEADAAGACRVELKIRIDDLVSADRWTMLLNGRALVDEPCRRDFGYARVPYEGIWLTFQLETVRPRRGENLLEFILEARPDGLVHPLVIQDVEIVVEYGGVTGSEERVGKGASNRVTE